LPSGRVLETLLSLKNLTIADTTFLEAIKCYPLSRNNLKLCNMNCRQYLYRQLEILHPKVVLALGDSATKCILDIKYDKFKEIVGKTYYLDINGVNIKIIPIYQPSPVNPNSLKGNQKIFKLFDI
jgi:DNA polymerase